MPPAKKTPAKKKSDTLPGGYKVGEKVFYTWSNHTFPSGNKLVHGQQGEVVEPATSGTHKGKGVKVLFPGNTKSFDCYLDSVRLLHAAAAATPPPPPQTRDTAHTPRVSRDSLCGAPALAA